MKRRGAFHLSSFFLEKGVAPAHFTSSHGVEGVLLEVRFLHAER
jgi:hypothetical protein